MKTALYKDHLNSDAKIVKFNDYLLPIQYTTGVIFEHNWVRNNAGIFDVSHLGQVILKGDNIPEFLSKITPSHYLAMQNGSAKYTALINNNGGIIDDLIITKISDREFLLVINAGCRQKDIDWIKENLPREIILEELNNRALIAIQGPKAEETLIKAINNEEAIHNLNYMEMKKISIKDSEAFVSRLGYTGEDGFEISIENEYASFLWNKLLDFDSVKPIGLGARDSLRLEAGYPLYGQDLNDKTTPISANISFIVSKHNNICLGMKHIIKEKETNPTRLRFGFKMSKNRIAREGCNIYNDAEEIVGIVTSGGFSPILGVAVGMAYINYTDCEKGKKLWVKIRSDRIEITLLNIPMIDVNTKLWKK